MWGWILQAIEWIWGLVTAKPPIAEQDAKDDGAKTTEVQDLTKTVEVQQKEAQAVAAAPTGQPGVVDELNKGSF